MFNHNVSPAERHWESKRWQDQLADEAIENRSEYQKLQNKYFLNHNDAERAFNTKEADNKFSETAAQAKWLQKERAPARELSFEKTFQQISAREGNAGIKPGSPEAKSTLNLDDENTAHTGKQVSTGSDASALIKSGQVLGDSKSVKDTQALLRGWERRTEEVSEKTKEPFLHGFGGTQNAIKETQNMPGFFSTPQDAQRERAWRHRFDEEAANLGVSGRIRQGALVEPGREYKNVAVEESLMPRLMELVQKLSAMGHSWARVVVPVDSRTNVVVRFNSQSGRVKIHLSTPSDELCRMIQAGWDALAGNLNERGISLDEPTFETNPYEH